MIFRGFYFSLKAIAKRLTVLLMSVMVLFSLSQTAALANPILSKTESASNSLIALAASSRFAAKSELANQESALSETKLDELREKRREWQSEASAAANTDEEGKSQNPVDNVVKKHLNLDEITEENEIVDEIKNH